MAEYIDATFIRPSATECNPAWIGLNDRDNEVTLTLTLAPTRTLTLALALALALALTLTLTLTLTLPLTRCAHVLRRVLDTFTGPAG